MIGVIQVDPQNPDEIFEYGHDKPGTDIWAFRNRKFRKRKRILVSDDGRFYFREMLFAPWPNWEGKLSIHDPGVVDPLPHR
jgi:hypothetical protein